jgi:UDP-glucose 4-epimerase
VILVTGGLGFIGSHTTRALLDLGEACIATQHRAGEIPDFLSTDLGERLIIEPLDVEDRASLSRIGERHAITGIVHLADSAARSVATQEAALRLDGLFDGLGHVLQAAKEWAVRRVTVASTIGVYGGVTSEAWTEDLRLPMVASHPIPTLKKCTELLAGLARAELGLEIVSVRPAAAWGPRGRPSSRFVALPALVHTAVTGRADLLPPPGSLYAGDGGDLCYVKDCGRAIALVQTAAELKHTTYNVGSGRVTTNAAVVNAIRDRVPAFAYELARGRTPDAAPSDPVLDLTRIRQDTPYEPAYDLESGIADYMEWLDARHER